MIDVRERVEFEAYAIDNAVNFPLTDILSRAREGSLSAKLREKLPLKQTWWLFTAPDTPDPLKLPVKLPLSHRLQFAFYRVVFRAGLRSE